MPSSTLSGYFEQVQTVTGVTTADNPDWSLKPVNGKVPSEVEEDAYNAIKSMITGNGTLTFYADEKPTTQVEILLKGVG